MPSFSYRSKLRAVSDHYVLNLNARHRLVVGTPSDTLYSMNKTRLPECVDVRLSSNLVVTLSGTVDGSEIPAVEIIASSLAQHFLDYLQTNASSLGLNTVSEMWIDDNDGLLKLTLTSSRQYPFKPELLPVHVLLVGLDLCYSWQTSTSSVVNTQPQWESHPFSHRLSLPFRTLLDNAVGRFVTWQLVQRYPLIFGQWRQQLDAEVSFFPSIFSSVLTIMKRSPNPMFRTKCQHLIKVMRRRHIKAGTEAWLRLEDYFREIPEVDLSSVRVKNSSLKDGDVLWLALERVYRDGMRRRQFKGLAGRLTTDRIDDEDLSQDHPLHLQHPTTFDDHLFSDITSARPPAHGRADSVLLDYLTSCNPPRRDMRMDLDLFDQSPLSDDSLLGDGFWSDPREISLDSGDDHDLTCCELNLNGNNRFPVSGDVDFEGNGRVIPLTVFEPSNNDLLGPFQLNFQTGCPDDQRMFAESENQCFLCDHILSQADGYEQNIEVVAGHRMGLLSQSRPFSTIAEPLSHQENDRYNDFSSQDSDTLAPKQPQSIVWSESREERPYLLPQIPIDAAPYHFIDVDMDLGILSDTEPTSSQIMEIASEELYDLEDFGEYREDVMPAGLVLSGEDDSHPAATLPVTCPSILYQLQYQEDSKDGEPRVEQIKSTLDWGVSADRDCIEAYPIEDWGEDNLVVVDF